jgi:hypothetical protein
MGLLSNEGETCNNQRSLKLVSTLCSRAFLLTTYTKIFNSSNYDLIWILCVRVIIMASGVGYCSSEDNSARNVV